MKKRTYVLNPINLKGFGPETLLKLAKSHYLSKYPTELQSKNNPFAYCILYLVIGPDKKIRLDFKYQQEVPLAMKFIHKRPKGGRPHEVIRNIDIREITNIMVPPYDNKYCFDFIIWVLDITTDAYWATNLWTMTVCPDLRYYLSKERKRRYRDIGIGLAEKYNETFVLGHVNLKTGRLKSSSGIRKLINHGWIPTISLLPQPYGEMVRLIESTGDMNQVNATAVKLFDDRLVDDILDRWEKASLIEGRREILFTAIERFKSKDFISTIHILLPQIEGLITKHIKRRGKIPEANIGRRFRQFGDVIKAETFNTRLTRYLSEKLVSYLKNVFYQTWYPFPRDKRYRMFDLAPQRHVVLHGEVNPIYFVAENCLKLICIIDAIILLSLTRSELRPARRIA